MLSADHARPRLRAASFLRRLAGESDDITTKEQVFDAEKYLGTPKNKIEKKLVPGGHIGLFMGSRTLKDSWPGIARWIAEQ